MAELWSLGGIDMSAPRDSSPKGVRRSAILATIGFSIFAASLGYDAASSEKSGETRELVVKGSAAVLSRATSPAEFRRITNVKWAACGFLTLSAAVSFAFYWRLRDYV